MNHTRSTATGNPAPGRPAAARRRTTSARLARRAVGCTLLGSLVITGPWTVPAVGHEDAFAGTQDAAPYFWPAAGGVPGPWAAGLYDIPFGPLPEAADFFPARPEAADVAPARPAVAAERWTEPVTGHPVSASYGIPGGWAAGYHTGIDWATPVGTPVRSVGPGTVVLAEYAGDYGNAVVVEMPDGYFTLYAHLSEISVRTGQDVNGGTAVGDSGDTGRSTGPHLHFEVRADRTYGTDVDPVAYLARHGVRV
ncbi:M23 family metallopeptidase [Streptomyces johnsoniae]|uniref:M23 family metallopeptidase n=1 Tax=Streptomyces johnsoniae TaxID=3075532 RepID=A0ABU2SFV4_9ACTN|nr:M23 family metallopeptidase [Streptomyces sp. DSM 41886]MDT0446774.1 M23 family metallopeptidase [Streptomyces sp. DSM 41886]